MTHEVRFLGHAAFEIVTGDGTRILIDPWISGNPNSPIKVDEVEDPDLVLITHDHFDHIGEDIPALVGGTDAVIFAQPEVVGKLSEEGVSDENVIFGMGMNVGGTAEERGITVRMVQAFHSAECGTPAGFLLTLEDGKTVYHAGDTGAFPGMQMLGEMYDIDLALLPIGSVFVMDPQQAAWAVEALAAERVVPMHYGTFPILVQDTDGFEELAAQKAPGAEIVALEPGESAEL